MCNKSATVLSLVGSNWFLLVRFFLVLVPCPPSFLSHITDNCLLFIGIRVLAFLFVLFIFLTFKHNRYVFLPWGKNGGRWEDSPWGKICIHMTDSLHCTAETPKHCNTTIPQFKNKNKASKGGKNILKLFLSSVPLRISVQIC